MRTPQLFVHGAAVANLAALPARPYEVGGWLLGYWSDDERSVFITHATPPASRGTPFGVRISGRGHRKRFDEAWTASGGLVTFLGDWHTHPASPPTPSERDEKALHKLATDPAYGTPNPLMVIVSTPRWPWHHDDAAVTAFFGSADCRPHALQVQIADQLPAEAGAVPNWPWPRRRARRNQA